MALQYVEVMKNHPKYEEMTGIVILYLKEANEFLYEFLHTKCRMIVKE